MPARTDTSSIETGSSATKNPAPASARAPARRAAAGRRRARAGTSASSVSTSGRRTRRIARRDALPMLAARDAHVAQRLDQAVADGEARVQRVERVLEHELRAAGGRCAVASPCRLGERCPALEGDRPAVGSSSRSSRRAGGGLAAAGFADDADGLAAAQGEATPSTARTAGRSPRSASPSLRGAGNASSPGPRSAAHAPSASRPRRGAGAERRALRPPASRRRRWPAASALAAARLRAALMREGAARREAAAGAAGRAGRAGCPRSDELAPRALEVGEGVGKAHGVGMARAFQHLGARARLHHVAGIHHHDASQA